MSPVRMGKVQFKIMHVQCERGRAIAREITDGLNRRADLRRQDGSGLISQEFLPLSDGGFSARRREWNASTAIGKDLQRPWSSVGPL